MSGAADDLDAIAARLVGSWRLVRWVIVHGDAAHTTTHPYGGDAEGLLVYTADGWMSGAIARPNRVPFSIGTLRTAPESERLASAASYFHYASRYTLRAGATGPQVVHAVRLAANPGMVGTEQVRDVAFDADGSLHLTGAERNNRGSPVRQHKLHWRRATP